MFPGLTLIYCAWLAPANFISIDASLTDCQILLYIITERYPSARKYRDIFERIKTAILGLIARGEHEPRNPVDHLMDDADLRARVATLGGAWGMSGMGADFSQMISQMTGQPMPAVAVSNSAIQGFSGQQSCDPGVGTGKGPLHPEPGVSHNMWPGIDPLNTSPDGVPGVHPMTGLF